MFGLKISGYYYNKKEFAYRLSDRQLDDIFEGGNTVPHAGPALADAGPMQDLGEGPNARPKRGAPLSSDCMTSSYPVNHVTIVVERKYAVQQ